MKRLSMIVAGVLVAALGCVVAASADNSTTIGTGTTVTTSMITTASDPPSAVSIRVKPKVIHTCPSRFATSTTVSGAITPSQTTPVTVTLQSRSVKGGSWTEVDSTDATAGFKFTQVGKCSKHGLWLRAVVEATDGTAVQSSQGLMKVVGHVDLDLIPGNQNTVRLKTGSKAPISTLVWGGDVASKVRYEARKKDATAWTLVQTCKRGKILARDGDAFKAYKCQFKVPKTPGVYYIRGHFKSSATTAETSTGTYTMTVVKR